MRHPLYPVRYFDQYGRPITTITISLPLSQQGQLHTAVSEAGDKAFGKDWGRAIVLGGMRLVVNNPKEATQ